MTDGLIYHLSLELSDQHDHILKKVFELNIVENISGETEIEDYPYTLSKIFPNPATTFITAEFAESLHEADAALHIYNIAGQHCRSYRIESGENIDISALGNGSYILLIQTKNKVIREKLIISR